ncbi:hypothetical protein SCYAM73S_00173 [Streptomyces cyaneofuscatus]
MGDAGLLRHVGDGLAVTYLGGERLRLVRERLHTEDAVNALGGGAQRGDVLEIPPHQHRAQLLERLGLGLVGVTHECAHRPAPGQQFASRRATLVTGTTEDEDDLLVSQHMLLVGSFTIWGANGRTGMDS